MIEPNQLCNHNKVKLGTSFLNWHYFTDTSLSQRIRITVSHDTALLFNIYWHILSALSREQGGSENQAAHRIFLTNSNDNGQTNKNVGNSEWFLFFFFLLVSPDEFHSREEEGTYYTLDCMQINSKGHVDTIS